MTARLAFAGLGAMGAGMAHRLLDSGFRLDVWNRTAAKAEPLVRAGARPAATPKELAARAGLTVLSLADEAAVEDVLFGQMLPELRPGHVVIDTSTVSPGYAREAAARLERSGLRRIEACVIGNPGMARQGRLRALVAAGEADLPGEVREVLDAISQDVVSLGAPGTAASMKLVFNLLLGAQTASLAEAAAFGVRAGLDRELLLAAVEKSGFSSPVLAFRAALMRTRSYEPALFRSALMEKDLRLAIAEATALGVPMPVAGQVAARFADVTAGGDGDRDAAVIAEYAVRPATG